MFGRQNQFVWTGLRRGAALLTFPLGLGAGAQMHHVDAPQRVTRAIGVYEWTGDLAKPTAARFVPVSLFIDGHMQDAGLYLARPVPFALQTGDVYALEHAGQPEGLFDLDYAQHVIPGEAVVADTSAGAWYGYGKFTPETTPKAPALHPSSHLPVIQADGKPTAGGGAGTGDDNRPHMNRRGSSSTPSTGSSSGGTGNGSGSGSSPDPATTSSTGKDGTGSGTGSTPAATSAPDASDDTDRPTLRHRDPSQDAARRREYGTKSKQASVTSAGPAPGDDPDRPVLGRSSTGDNGVPPLTGLPADLHQAVAVSDPIQRDHHDFARDWDSPAEREQTLAALAALAQPRVMAYLKENRLVPSRAPLPSAGETRAKAATTPVAKSEVSAVTAGDKSGDDDPATPPKLERGVPTQYGSKPPAASSPAAAPSSAPPQAAVTTPAPTAKPATAPATSKPAAHHVTPRPGSRPVGGQAVPLQLTQGEIAGYTLTYGGLPTFVYTAAASVTRSLGASSPNTAAAKTVAHADLPPAPPQPANAVYVTVVAQRLPSGELQVALSNVTDSLHLDRGPRLRLIDAVDPDDSHRASLLFELRGATSRQFALYRLTAVQAEETFTTASIE